MTAMAQVKRVHICCTLFEVNYDHPSVSIIFLHIVPGNLTVPNGPLCCWTGMVIHCSWMYFADFVGPDTSLFA